MTTEHIFCLQSPSSSIKQLLWQTKVPPGARPWGSAHLEFHRLAVGTDAADSSLPASGCAPLTPGHSSNSEVPRKVINTLLPGEENAASWIPSSVSKRGLKSECCFLHWSHNFRYWCLCVHFRYWSCWHSCISIISISKNSISIITCLLRIKQRCGYTALWPSWQFVTKNCSTHKVFFFPQVLYFSFKITFPCPRSF